MKMKQNEAKYQVDKAKGNATKYTELQFVGYQKVVDSEKIIGGYEFQINYDESKKPSFISDWYQFTVVMPNLNYNVPQDVPRNVPQKKVQSVGKPNIEHDKKDNKISTEKWKSSVEDIQKRIK